MIEALRRSRGMIATAAESLGVSRPTVYAYIGKYPRIAEVLEDEREKFVDVMELALYKQVLEGNVQAITFGLRTLGRGRGYVERPSIAVEGALNIGFINSWQDIADAGLTRESVLAETLRLFDAPDDDTEWKQ